MDLSSLHDFLIASAGASASFIGLLFVALSFILSRDDSVASLEFSDRRLAESAYAGLTNIFFISLVALIPGNSIGYVAFITASIGIYNSWKLFAQAPMKKKAGAETRGQWDIFLIAMSALVYSIEGVYAILLIIHPQSAFDLDVIVYIIIALFATELIRSWQLTGIRSMKKG